MIYCVCNIAQNIITTPGQYSRLLWWGMRFLPERFSPKFDPVKMFSREEVKDAIRQRRAAKKSKLKQEFPISSPAHPEHVPNAVQSKMKNKWRDAYLKTRMNDADKTKTDACRAVYKQEFFRIGLNSAYDIQIRELFRQWSSEIRRADPVPDKSKKKEASTKASVY
ncbi:hypothetical protein COOONC_03117 [Cooperia oncophora]